MKNKLYLLYLVGDSDLGSLDVREFLDTLVDSGLRKRDLRNIREGLGKVFPEKELEERKGGTKPLRVICPGRRVYGKLESLRQLGNGISLREAKSNWEGIDDLHLMVDSERYLNLNLEAQEYLKRSKRTKKPTEERTLLEEAK